MCSYRTCGIVFILLGLYILRTQIILDKIVKIIRTKLPLIEGTETYKGWSSPIHLTFSCYVFNVTNPDEVMRGEKPNLTECGPYTYDEMYEKQIIDVDEETDEITYTATITYNFNKHLSVKTVKHDKITILNPAYIGTIGMLSSLPPDFMKKYGDNIPKLFPNKSSIFLQTRPTDVLFNGVKVSCNLRKYPELNLVCKTLKANRPPVLKETEREDVYLLSMFQRQNASIRGPFTVNRGLKDITKMGDITAFKGRKVQTIWSSDSCNTVRGSDTVIWAPLIEPLPFVSTFIPELCRSIDVDYEDDISVLGLTGSRFLMKERTWFLNETECYCLLVNKQPQCLPKGLLDVSECQKVPVILSEPHFLHGDPQLLTYASGLNPDEKVHGTYIVIEPLTGTPLSGQKKIQVNVKLTKQPVELLQNVSEGYFPLLWCADGNAATLSVIPLTYQTNRLLKLVCFMQKLPLIIGIYMIFISLLHWDFTKRKIKPTTSFAEAILISSNSQPNNITRRPPSRIAQAFQ